MKKAFVIILVLVLVGAGIWFFMLRDSGGEEEAGQYQPKDYPERLGDAEPTAAAAQYQSSLSNLVFEYPQNWNVTESADNSEDAQLLTVESPLDINRFYFCLDMNVVSGAEAADFSITDADIKAVETLESGRQSVIYSVKGLDGLHWGVTDETQQVGGESFTGEIASGGSRMQVFGRFNCREQNRPDLTLDEFKNARWFKEAQGIVGSLQF